MSLYMVTTSPWQSRVYVHSMFWETLGLMCHRSARIHRGPVRVSRGSRSVESDEDKRGGKWECGGE
jgi:hypothetical protein